MTATRPPDHVRSVYVVCERDEALPPALQREQIESAGITEVVSLDAGHSAFASRPAELAALLLAYA